MTQSDKGSEHILVVDDDPRIRQMLCRYFEDEGYRVTAVADGASMRNSLRDGAIDIILLDLILPGGEDGIGLAREIRTHSNVPIIMLTGRDDVIDRIVGLEVGADDYVAKPFHLREVLARLKSVLRRRQTAAPPAAASVEVWHFEGHRLDMARRELTGPDGATIELTTGEFDMLAIFVRHAGRVLTRDTLMDMTRRRHWEAFDRTIDAQIARLRKKIERDSKNPKLIKSVRGVGYIFSGRDT